MKSDPLDVLNVINRLEVGPVKIEPSRVSAPYHVARRGQEDSIELVYRYEEDVFSPGSDMDINLGSMIMIQAALNYGLFCDEIVFNGSFDKDDQRFIEEMAENTAREILVKKLLEPNPFLIDEAASLPLAKKEAYLRAKLTFNTAKIETAGGRSEEKRDEDLWRSDSSRYAVLSSGGKESLLSFNLLREIGIETHPIFINESGRHWFTALNAYRFFKTNIPQTGRVWTNIDRVYNWMLRNLPFIRPNFSRVRSDKYPIRLWTVAGFLFGALPLLKKKGLGRLIIGDEYDTTVKLSHQGIMNYNGLFDQSRYFDNSLTRYFHRKGWGISQFSILRPLSELLIEKILIERYPDFLQLQVSCHAAHKEGEKVFPCGLCEKCRRIVGMLTALKADPERCGYSPHQIETCLEELSRKGNYQERDDQEHLAFLLSKNGVSDRKAIGHYTARERPWIMKLRFDADRSPVEGIPIELREPIYRIFLEHSLGSVRRRGRTWADFNLMQDSSMKRPYLFDRSRKQNSNFLLSGNDARSLKGKYLLGELTWPEAETRFQEVDVALLPVGAIEQHGPHLPLDSDAFDAGYLAQKVAEACTDPKPLVLPLIPYGVSYHHEDFSGTISIGPETLSQLVYEIGVSASRHGITKLVIINGHGGNSPALHFAAQMINRDVHIFTCVDTGETSDPDIYTFIETPNDVHAGEIETSTTLASRPHLVKKDRMKRFVPRFSNRYLNFSSKRSVGWYAHTSKISSTGVLGDPTKANLEKGERIWELMVKNLAEFVEELKNISMDEIYQKRY